MENTSLETIYTGVNIFIFVIAMTISINLMVSVKDMAAVANDIAKEKGNGSLVESYNTENMDKEKYISGAQVLNYVQKKVIIKYTDGEDGNEKELEYNQLNKYIFNIKEGGHSKEITVATTDKIKKDAIYSESITKSENKYIVTFTEKTD